MYCSFRLICLYLLVVGFHTADAQKRDNGSVVELKQHDSSGPGRLVERKLKTWPRQEDQYNWQQLAQQAQASWPHGDNLEPIKEFPRLLLMFSKTFVKLVRHGCFGWFRREPVQKGWVFLRLAIAPPSCNAQTTDCAFLRRHTPETLLKCIHVFVRTLI